MGKKIIGILCICLGAMISPSVSAHSILIEEGFFLAGFIHPWLGTDHLLPILASGIWAAQQGGNRLWQIPFLYTTLLIIGAVSGLIIDDLAAVQSAVIVSLLIVGILLTFSIRISTIPCLLLASVFAVFQGYVHGSQVIHAETYMVYIYLYGLIFSSCFIQVLGIGLAQFAIKLYKQKVLRLTGLAMGVTGIWLWG